jgi:hypothetical protein
VNAIEFNFFLSVLCVCCYVVVSLVTCRRPFNLERMLHRGKYSLGERRDIRRKWTPRTVLRNIIGITPEYTRGDRIIAWGVFFYSFGYGFGVCFLGTVICNIFHPWPIRWWSPYFVVRYFIVPCIVSFITIFWFGIGGIIGLIGGPVMMSVLVGAFNSNLQGTTLRDIRCLISYFKERWKSEDPNKPVQSK